VFLEPEGRACGSLIYPNGLSNSLPQEAQDAMVRAVPGLERARFVSYGYAIEYDCFNSLDLKHTLETKAVPGLYLAGQINGTTGYEEAAVLGFMAGVNAALKVRDTAPFILSRQEAYVGVMIDDLVTKGTNEPYRMFTSRAERRLLLRQDNARFRLLPQARYLGVAPHEFLDESAALSDAIAAEIQRLEQTRLADGTPLDRYLARPEVSYVDLPASAKHTLPVVAEQVELAIKYAGYIDQERRQAERAAQMDRVVIPEWVDYWDINSLRYECREKLSRIRPASFGQAARIPGVTPADLSVLSVVIKRGKNNIMRP
jgi:tRNA uridine 5-carboxymethylaminomethyl modification enzyme